MFVFICSYRKHSKTDTTATCPLGHTELNPCTCPTVHSAQRCRYRRKLLHCHLVSLLLCGCCYFRLRPLQFTSHSSPVPPALPLPFQLPASLWSSLPLPLPACPSHSYVNCRNTKNIYKHYLIMKLFSAINNTRHCSRRRRRKRTVQGGGATRGRAGECQLT